MSLPINSQTKMLAAKLAYITYLDEDSTKKQKTDMEGNLEAIPKACNGPFKLVWGPAINHGILCYIAQGADGAYVIAFRGTLTSFGDAIGAVQNILDDLTGFRQVPWQFPLSAEAQVTWGTNDALTFAIGATDHSLGISMLDFLRRNLRPANKPVMVAGHSLGGALANVASVWLMDQIPKDGGPDPVMVPFTFAAPTISDGKFADLYAKMCPASYHCINKHDIVPMAWTNFEGIEGSYAPNPTLRGFNPGLWMLVQMAAKWVESFSDRYVEVPGTKDVFEVSPQAGADNFVTAAGKQHSIQGTYLKYVDPENILLL